jgi:hypothetical protein
MPNNDFLAPIFLKGGESNCSEKLAEQLDLSTIYPALQINGVDIGT